MMNLEKSNEKKDEITKSTEAPQNPKKTSFSQTPQPSLKNVNHDKVKIIEEEISQIADAKKQTKQRSPLFFGVKQFFCFGLLYELTI